MVCPVPFGTLTIYIGGITAARVVPLFVVIVRWRPWMAIGGLFVFMLKDAAQPWEEPRDWVFR
jgi:hypothetical protein